MTILENVKSQSTLDGSQQAPNGGAWAAILAGGIGCAAFGLFCTWAECSKSIGDALNFYNPVGNLSGKTTLGILVWLIAWTLLHLRWKNQILRSTGKIMAITLILVLLSLITTFPLFFELINGG